MTDQKADELINALNENSLKVVALNNNIDALYNLVKGIELEKELKLIKTKLNDIIASQNQ